MSANSFWRGRGLIQGLAHFLVRSKWSYLAIGLGFPLFWIASWICARYAPSFFIEVAREDSWIENAQVVVLVVGVIMSGYLARKLYGEGLKLCAVLYSLFALVLFFMAGEEISWGQRIFGVSTPPWFMKRNYQHELNIHNLRSGRPLVRAVRIGCPALLIALSASYAALGEKRIEKWRAYLCLPHPILIPLWLCYLSYSAIGPLYQVTHPGKVETPDVISRLSEPAELIIYSGTLLFISMVLTHETSVELKAERH
jgi:hypothetical protein